MRRRCAATSSPRRGNVLDAHGPVPESVSEAGSQPVVQAQPRAWRRAPEPEGAASASARLLLSGLFALALVALAAGAGLHVQALRAIGLFGALAFGVGATPLQLSRRQGLATRLGVACLFGLSVLMVIGETMALSPFWHPALLAALIGGGAAAVHLASVRDAWPTVLAQRPEWAGRLRWSRAAWSWRPALCIGCTLVGTALWLGTAIASGHIVPANGGFPTKISLAWYAGVLLVLAAIALARGRREAYVIAAVASLIAALTLTPALVYGTPGQQTATKHIELVQAVLSAHFLNRGVGIYNAYSGFFAGIAWLCSVGGIRSAFGIATFWPCLIGAVRLAETRWMFAPMIRSRYRLWCAITLVLLVDAIGGDYFSPQSVGYVLGLGAYAVAVERGPNAPGTRTRFALLLATGCALAVTHELSPYIVGGVLIVFGVFNYTQPRLAALLVLVPAGLWTLFNHSVLAGFLNVLDFGNLSNFAPPKTVASAGLARQAIVGESAHALLLGLLVLILAAGIGWARHIHARWAWACAVAPAVGLVFIAFNSYGNEGIFRATLFAIPWLAVLAASAVRTAPPRGTSIVYGLATVLLLGTFLLASFGLDGVNVIRRSDFTSLTRFEAQAPIGSFLLSLGNGGSAVAIPTTFVADHFISWEQLLTPATGLVGTPTKADVRTLTRRYLQYVAANSRKRPAALYALFSPALVVYGVDYGLMSAANADRWRDLLRQSPKWTVAYQAHGTYLFKLISPDGLT